MARIAAVLSAALILIAPGSSSAVGECPIQNGVYNVYLSAAGTLTGDGCTPLTAMRDLNKIDDKLKAEAPNAVVFVNIDATAPITTDTVKWEYFHPQHTTYFLPYGIDNPSSLQGSWWPSQVRPILRANAGVCGYFFWFEPPGLTSDTATRLEFIGLQIEGFAKGGIGLRGQDGARVTQNKISNLIFKNIGTKHNTKGELGMGAVSLSRAAQTTINYTTFESIENGPWRKKTATRPCMPKDDDENAEAHIHSVYIQHDSDNNLIDYTDHAGISGDPIRVRDGADNNTVRNSTFTDAGAKAAISDWLNDDQRDCVLPGAQGSTPGECPSMGNIFRDNVVGKRWESTTDARYKCVNHRDDRSNPPDPPNAENCWTSSAHRIDTATGNSRP